MAEYKNKQVDHSINSSQTHPLSDISLMVGGVLILSLLVVSLIYYSSSFVTKFISIKDEVKLMNSSSIMSLKLREFNSTEAKITNLVNELWKPFDETNNVEIHVELSDLEMENAFMSIGGKMTFTRSLLENLKSENELVFIACHELGHFYNRDVIRGLSTKLSLELFKNLFGLNNLDLVRWSIESSKLQFSREQELKADKFAVNCMNLKYGHIQDYDSYFTRMVKKEENHPEILNYLSTHPGLQDRINLLKKIAKEKGIPLTGKIFNFSL